MNNYEKYQYKPESKLAFSLRANGYLFPISIEQVKLLEENHESIFQNVPSNITSAEAILERGIITFEPAFQIHVNEETRQNLAQAAREGKEISDEIRQQMQRDRLEAIKRKGKK